MPRIGHDLSMTSATGPGLSADDLFRRLRAWPAASWGHGDRVGHTRAALHRLADLAGRARGRPAPPVPDLDVTALGDQLVVLSADAVAAGVPEEQVTAVLADLARDLRLT